MTAKDKTETSNIPARDLKDDEIDTVSGGAGTKTPSWTDPDPEPIHNPKSPGWVDPDPTPVR